MNAEPSPAPETAAAEEMIDVEVIMRQIREHLAQQRGGQPPAEAERPGAAFDVSFYEELHAANQDYDRLYVAPYLTPSRLPVLGGLWQRVRAVFHGLVVFYVNRLAEAQMRFNAHAVRVLNEIVRTLDQADTADEMARLTRRVEALEERLKRLEGGNR
ncbi:MAG: hypothetical protein ACP5UQ_06325 [Anaerolineae bacterium]